MHKEKKKRNQKRISKNRLQLFRFLLSKRVEILLVNNIFKLNMSLYKIKFIRSEEVAEGTMAFYFEKPINFDYKAGQNADLTLINPSQTDEEGNTRTLSFISAPYELELGFATRMRPSAFKNVLKDFKEGSEVNLDGPYGDFILPEDEITPLVFLIGGIGVTPIISMIKEATYKHTNHKLILIHANKNQSLTPFLKDFLNLEKENLNFKYVEVFSESNDIGENIESGRINPEVLKKYVSNIGEVKYYLSGPEAMVKAMREMLVSLNISQDNIITEEFGGY